MRPLTLDLEGFTAFRRPTRLDLSELDLFAITGPTGAGKSSLIDAICYALYGKVPRVKDEVGSLISLGHDRMQVSLEFLAGGQRYRVLRETPRKGSGRYRLEQASQDGDWQPLADRAREVTLMVERIVGLDFEAFIRSALLPQGQFQEFLAGSPERRRDVLHSLLRLEIYERMRTRAGQEAQSLQVRVAEIERRLTDELADATPETLARRQQELAQARDESQRLERQVAALQQGIDLAHQLATALTELRRQLAAREAAQARLAAAKTVLDGGDARLVALREEQASAQERLATNTYDDQLLADLTGAANLALQFDRLSKAANEASAALVTLAKEAETAQSRSEATALDAERALIHLEATQASLEEARRHDLAAALQAGLHAGDACPVCGGLVGELPHGPGDDLEAARIALDEARRQDQTARDAASSATTKAAVTESNLRNAQEQSEERVVLLAETTQALADALPAMKERSLALIQAALAEQRQAREERSRLEKQTADLTRELADEEQRLQTARADVAAFAVELSVAAAAAEQAKGRSDLVTAQLTEAAEVQGWQGAIDDLAQGRDPLPGLDSQLKDASANRTGLLTSVGRLEEQVRRVEQDIELAAALRKELGGKKNQLDVAADLAQMLSANRFQAYVQSRALRSLAEDGSRRLMDLSAGRYELEVAPGGQDFLVKDKWNADEPRPVRTLSGGETFLASLALALALAETLPGLAPGRRLALDSIFLDEGFGSLDPEALDRAADALDALRVGDRLVCVITHLKELAERMPAQVMVKKSEDGSTIAIL